MWAFPYDPALPALSDAAYGRAVRDKLGGAGKHAVGVAVQPIRYRPRSRAVFHYLALDHGAHTYFGKVMRRSRVRRTRALARGLRTRFPWRRRDALRLALPLDAHGRSTDALLFPRLPGASLRDLLITGGSLPSPARVAQLLDRVTAVVGRAAASIDGGPIHDPTALTEHALTLLRHLVPDAVPDLARLTDAIREAADDDVAPATLVHGDLYEAQVLVDDEYSLGLVDLDDVGVGDPAFDAANFCAHLVALALSVPPASGRLLAYRTLVRDAFLERLGVSPPAMAWREALALLLLASGPFRVLDPAWPYEVQRRIGAAISLFFEA